MSAASLTFYQVLIERVATAHPAPRGRQEGTGRDVDVGPHEPGEGLGPGGGGGEEVGFCFLCEGAVGRVANQVGEARPF